MPQDGEFLYPIKTRRAFRLLGLVVAMAVALGSSSAEAATSILLIGNSFTGGLKPKLQSLIRSSGRDVTIVARAASSWTLADHAASPSTRKKIDAKAWDYVVLQEQSLGLFHERYPSARVLDAEIGKKGSQTVFFMTWRDAGAPMVSYDSLHGQPGEDVGYIPIAFELGAPVAPVGWAFRETAIEAPEVDLWAGDGHHASDRGRYVAALTLFATIFDESPVGLWGPRTMTAEEILHDQLLVEEVTLTNPSEWNIQP
ncbi:MAG: hypothetical protein HY899_05530 [Deltaproteobacteria bacterium]|nr:hypothetical protein [Deltaproteobacteria bacterium]